VVLLSLFYFRDNLLEGEETPNSHAPENQGFAAEDDGANNLELNNVSSDEDKNAFKDTPKVDEDVRAAGKGANKTGSKDGAKKDGVKGNAAKGKKVVKKPAKKPVETLDEKYKIPQIPKAPTPPPMKYPERGNKEFREETASAKDRKRREIEELKAELRKAKNARVETEKERESKVRRAKMLQNQMLQKRNQGGSFTCNNVDVNTTTVYEVMDGPLPFGQFGWAVTKTKKSCCTRKFEDFITCLC